MGGGGYGGWVSWRSLLGVVIAIAGEQGGALGRGLWFDVWGGTEGPCAVMGGGISHYGVILGALWGGSLWHYGVPGSYWGGGGAIWAWVSKGGGGVPLPPPPPHHCARRGLQAAPQPGGCGCVPWVPAPPCGCCPSSGAGCREPGWGAAPLPSAVGSAPVLAPMGGGKGEQGGQRETPNPPMDSAVSPNSTRQDPQIPLPGTQPMGGGRGEEKSCLLANAGSK